MTNYKKTFKIFQRLSAADTAHLCKELSIADSQMIGHAARALALACKIYSWDGYTEENKQKIYRQFLTETPTMKYKFNIFSIIFGLIALACFGGVIRLSSPFDPLNLAIGFTGAIFSIAMIALNVCVFILELVENINLDHGPR